MCSRSIEYNVVFRLYNIAMLYNLDRRYPEKTNCALSSYSVDMTANKFWNSVTPALKTRCIQKYSAFVWLCLALDHSVNQQEDVSIFAMLRAEMPGVGGAQAVNA